ncbi:MAG: hypothetical protein AAGM22_09190 [Acidobacteriota bacterium]
MKRRLFATLAALLLASAPISAMACAVCAPSSCAPVIETAEAPAAEKPAPSNAMPCHGMAAAAAAPPPEAPPHEAAGAAGEESPCHATGTIAPGFDCCALGSDAEAPVIPTSPSPAGSVALVPSTIHGSALDGGAQRAPEPRRPPPPHRALFTLHAAFLI